MSGSGNAALYLADALSGFARKRGQKREHDSELERLAGIRSEDIAYRNQRDAAADAHVAADRERQSLMDAVNLAGGQQSVTLGRGERVGPVAGGGVAGMPGLSALTRVIAEAGANANMTRAGQLPGGPQVFVNPDRPARLQAVQQERQIAQARQLEEAERAGRTQRGQQAGLGGRELFAFGETGSVPAAPQPRQGPSPELVQLADGTYAWADPGDRSITPTGQQAPPKAGATDKAVTELDRSLQTLEVLTQNPSAAGDVAFGYAFMKLLDPETAVREGELSLLGSAKGLRTTLEQVVSRAKTGESLTPEQRQDYLRQARAIVQARKQQQGVASPLEAPRDSMMAPSTPQGAKPSMRDQIMNDPELSAEERADLLRRLPRGR